MIKKSYVLYALHRLLRRALVAIVPALPAGWLFAGFADFKSQLPEIEALAHQLFNQRRVELTDSLAREFSQVLRSQRPK
jgi:hypothetical protein